MKQVAGRLLHVTKFFGIGCYENGPLCFEAELLLKTSDAEEGNRQTVAMAIMVPMRFPRLPGLPLFAFRFCSS